MPPTDIIEMFWGCTVCNAENLGRRKTCKNCGAPRTEKSPEWMPGDLSPMAAVKDPKLLQKFKAGADWKCKYCGSSQFRADGNCAQCGSEQENSISPASLGRLADAALEPEPDPFSKRRKPEPTDNELRDLIEGKEEPEPFVTEGNYREAPKRAPTPISFEEEVPLSIPLKQAPKKFSISPKFLIRGGVTLALGVLGLVLYLIFHTRIIDTHVTAVQWTYTVSVDRYQVWSREGWTPDYGAFDTHDQGSRIHHYDHVRVGSHQEHYNERVACGQDCRTIKGSCYTTTRNCTSNKNGSATCSGGDYVCDPDTQSCTTRYCDEPRTRTVDDYEDQPRYQDWYSWHVWDWGHNRNVVSAGATTETHWPPDSEIRLGMGLARGEKERESGRQESYTATLFGDKSYEYIPKSLTEFQKFPVGSQHKIKVGVAHGVEVLPPPN